MAAEGWTERARALYERAFFGGDNEALAVADRELDTVEADLALARGRIVHARFLADRIEDPAELELFERAARLYRSIGDLRGEGEALFWVSVFHQVLRGDHAQAVPTLERSAELAIQAHDQLTLSYALRHLAIAAHAEGRTQVARERLTESTRLRRELGFEPGVAANLVGLAYMAAADGRRDEALSLVDEAQAVAEACGAAGILRQVDEARAAL